MSCQLDGAPVVNHMEDQCKSPLQMRLNDKKNHTLEITMTVSCWGRWAARDWDFMADMSLGRSLPGLCTVLSWL
jgi:hypothetical protein